MKPIVAEEITAFDTSLDRLWARRDLLVLVPGALICMRSIHQRALRIGALGRLRCVRLRAEDYVLGTAEEEICRAVRAAAELSGVRVIVIYLSCLDILIRPDFVGLEERLAAETGCVVRCFFRGPLANADAAVHETAEELLAGLPPEMGEIAAPADLPPPMSDVAGVSDFLRAEGAAHVLITPAGCRNALVRADITAEQEGVYALIPKAEDYIFGMEETAAAEVTQLVAEGQHRAVHLLTSPVPAFMAMAAEPVLAAAEEHGCRACCTPTDGFRDAIYGVAAETLRIVEEAAALWGDAGRTLLILGYSPLLLGDDAPFAAALAPFLAEGYAVAVAGRDVLTERPALVWLVSAAGVSAAEWLHAHYATPVVRSLPLGVRGHAAWRAKMRRALGDADEPVAQAAEEVHAQHPARILIIGDPLASTAMAGLLAAYGYADVRCAAYAWDTETAELYRRAADGAALLIFQTAEELRPAWDAAEIVIGDPILVAAMGEKRILPLPSGFLAGRAAAGAGSGVLGTAFAAILQEFLGA